MQNRAARVVLALASLVLLARSAAAADPPLTVVSASPTGELSSHAQSNEIRVVFSEPMVALGRIPNPVTAPFFHITPAATGTFRWSGTTILIFTPGRPNALPFATTFRVTIDASATAVSGRRLAAPYTVAFTTPTVQLLSTQWYRRTGAFDSAAIVALRFNQPVRPADVAARATFKFEKHAWTAPVLSVAAQARLRATEPQALAAFNAKVGATAAAAAADAPLEARLATDWDRRRFPPSPDLVVFEIVTRVPPESAVRVTIGAGVPSPAGTERSPRAYSYTIHVESAFFVNRVECQIECDPDLANAISLTGTIPTASFGKALSIVDVTEPAREKRVAPASQAPARDDRLDRDSDFTIEDGGYDPQPPARTYAIRLDPSLQSIDGQTLGYSWVAFVENWHQRAFTSFGGGHGVWESAGGPVLPFYARNLADVRWWTAAIGVSDLMPSIVKLRSESFNAAPEGSGQPRRLPAAADTIQSPGLDLTPALASKKTGLVWAAVQEGNPIPRSKPAAAHATRASLVQVTNLGISVKDSPQNTLVFVTRLDNAAPVSGATVSIINTANRLIWRGTTDKDGLALASDTPLRGAFADADFSFIVTAEKDGDVAYVGSDWTEGTHPYQFDYRFDLNEASPQVRGTVFADRGVYKPGEEAHLKAIFRHDTAGGMRLLAPDAPIKVVVRDTNNKIVDRRTLTLNAWSSTEWTLRVPADGALGTYSVVAGPEPEKPAATKNDEDTFGLSYGRGAYVRGTFLVAAYRRPDFRVDTTLTANQPIAGGALNGLVNARYLFGSPMVKRPVRWTYTRMPVYSPPATLTERFTDARFVFVGCCYEPEEREELASEEATLTAKGEFSRDLDTKEDAGLPYRYTFEGEVEDLSRQRIAGRASIVVHPAPWYIGVREAADFVDAAAGFDTEIVAVTPDGRLVPNVTVNVTLSQQQWYSARRAEGHGFYAWDSQRGSIDGETLTVTTGTSPVPLHVPVPQGGSFVLRAVAKGEGGRYAITQTNFYALGRGYTAWERFDDNRVNLVPERQTYKPGETARIMIQSPWERATALVSTEREGVRTYRQFALTSTQQTVAVPLTEADIPNVYVSVLLIKGRTVAESDRSEPVVSERAGGLDEPRHPRQAVVNDGSDPGKPAFRLGYTELKVEDSAKKLTVGVKANKVEYRPASAAKIDIEVKDRRGQPAASEVTLWAVDYGVLSLTGFRTPDVLGSIYVEKALQVVTTDNRERLISRRVMVPKGTEDGGGGGSEKGPGTLRKDFRVLAFWVGSVITDARGRATTTVTLPESLTTYRIMAVAGDKASRFGSADSEIRINKPVLLRAAYPRFLAVGDSAFFGSLITNQLKDGGTAVVSIRSLDPGVLEIRGDARKSVDVAGGASAEVRFDAVGKSVGRARVQMSVRLRNEGDAFEDIVPVEVLSSTETVAAYGEARPDAREKLTMPEGVVPGFGGLHVEVSSTAMVGLGEGAKYLVDYPYGCAEQRSSRTLALLLATDLGDAFKLPGLEPSELRKRAQAAVTELAKFQCPDGAIALWPGACDLTSPYLTAYIMHVMQTARALSYDVPNDVLERGYTSLQRELSKEPPPNEGWSPWFTAWQAFAVKVLVEGGRNQDSALNRLYGHRDTMPVFGLAYLADAMAAGHETGARPDDLGRRIANSVLPEAGGSHIEELTDPYLMWFWNSNVRSTAIALESLVRNGGGDSLIAPMVRWLLAVRRGGRWGNTQENALAMEALVAYYRKFEKEPPSFTAVVALGGGEIARDQFAERSTEARAKDLPLAALATTLPAGSTKDLTFHREGTGNLFYSARLQYAVDSLFQEGLDSGFALSRRYSIVDANGNPLRDGTTFQAGDLVRVTLTFELTKERRFVALVDPVPAGLEPIESWFETTAEKTAEAQERATDDSTWGQWWRRGGFDHSERQDDRIVFFATRLSEGRHETSYLARATTAGTFRTAPAHAEEMYQPEVFGRTATAVVEVKR